MRLRLPKLTSPTRILAREPRPAAGIPLPTEQDPVVFAAAVNAALDTGIGAGLEHRWPLESELDAIGDAFARRLACLVAAKVAALR